MAKGQRKIALLERSLEPDSTERSSQARPDENRVTTALVEDISPDGVALIVITGEERARKAASVLGFPSADAASRALLGRTVLVLMEGSADPVIMGVIEQRLWQVEPAGESEAHLTLPPSNPMSIRVDRRRLDLEAADEIRLSCGKSSLLLRRDGTVIVRGVKIVSRASQSNKIRGGTVSLN